MNTPESFNTESKKLFN